MKKSLLFFVFSLLVFANTANTTTIPSVDENLTGESALAEYVESDRAMVADVTFCVDLECFAISDAVAVAFGYQAFAPTNFLALQGGTRTYCGTFSVPDGEQEFKFFFAQGQFEDLAGAGDCVNGNNNRTITVVDGVPQSVTYGWESCEADCPPPATADVTFCVDVSCFPATDAVAVAFGFQSFAPVNGLADQGGGIYCGTYSVPAGVQEYKYFFAQEQFEDLAGAGDCVNAANNRTVTVAANTSQTVNDGWESCDQSCTVPSPAGTEVTLCVDLSCQQSATAPSVFGAFNGWNAGANPVTDPDDDGVYCATVIMMDGAQEYLFFTQETGPKSFAPGAPCTVTNFGFTNRVINVAGQASLMGTYGWETCEEDCGNAPVLTPVTLCVDLSCFPNATAPSVFGAFNGWNAGANPVFDTNGDGIYCATVMMLPGDQEYKFFFQEEGAESFDQGASCTTTNFGFTNRVITVGDQPVTETYGWNSCGTNCIAPANITFCVDLNCTDINPSNVNIFGGFNGWNPGANPLNDFDGDGIYCTTISMPSGNQEFKFLANGVEESFSIGDPCTVTCCGGQFTNRVLSIQDGVDQTVSFDWESCEKICVPQPWDDVDGGINCGDGSSSAYNVDTEVFTLESSNCLTGNFASDRAAYISADLCGNGEIIARVTSISPFNFGWAGISMRENGAPGAKKMALSTNLSNFGRREVRTTTNGFAFPQQFFRPGATWLRLVRTGNTFIGYMSTNGLFWQQVMVANIGMSGCIEVGLFATNTNISTVTATFDNVSINGGSNPSLVSDTNFGGAEGLTNQAGNGDFSVYPNPATEEIYLDLQDYYGQDAQVDLINNLGMVVQTRQLREIGSNKEKLNLAGLSNGLYFVRIKTDFGEVSKRFLIVD